jgi:hypothetical protein
VTPHVCFVRKLTDEMHRNTNDSAAWLPIVVEFSSVFIDTILLHYADSTTRVLY